MTQPLTSDYRRSRHPVLFPRPSLLPRVRRVLWTRKDGLTGSPTGSVPPQTPSRSLHHRCRLEGPIFDTSPSEVMEGLGIFSTVPYRYCVSVGGLFVLLGWYDTPVMSPFGWVKEGGKWGWTSRFVSSRSPTLARSRGYESTNLEFQMRHLFSWNQNFTQMFKFYFSLPRDS